MGFLKSRTIPLHVRRQLADHLMYAAVTRQWIKPYTVNSRNKKYAMRTWMNFIGMTGDEFAEARKCLLDPLPGRTDRKGTGKGGDGRE